MYSTHWQLPCPHLTRELNGNYRNAFRETALGIGIKEMLCARRSPWENAYAERLIGSIRRECLDHVIVLHEPGLRRVLTACFAYYTYSRAHRSIEKDAPVPRASRCSAT